MDTLIHIIMYFWQLYFFVILMKDIVEVIHP